MGITSSNNSTILKNITEIHTWIQKKRNEFAHIKHHVKNPQKKKINHKICLFLYKLNSKGYMNYLGFARKSKSSTWREPITESFMENLGVLEIIMRDQELKSSMPFTEISTTKMRAKSWRNRWHWIRWKGRHRKHCGSSHRIHQSSNHH